MAQSSPLLVAWHRWRPQEAPRPASRAPSCRGLPGAAAVSHSSSPGLKAGRSACRELSPPHLGGVSWALRLSCDCSLLCDLCQGPVNPVPSLDLTAVTFTLETVQLRPIPRTEAQRFSTCPGAKAPSCGHPALPCPRPSDGAPEAGSRARGRREVGTSFPSPSICPSAHGEGQRLRTGALKPPPSETHSALGGPGGLPTEGLARDIWWCVFLHVCWLHVS